MIVPERHSRAKCQCGLRSCPRGLADKGWPRTPGGSAVAPGQSSSLMRLHYFCMKHVLVIILSI